MESPESPPQPATGHAGGVRLRALHWRDPFHWLALGSRDFARSPLIGLFYGACFVGMGWTLMKVFQHAPAYLLALSAGFVLAGPFLCVGLYQVSQRLERGQRPDLGESLLAWDQRMGAMALFALTMLVLEMLWARATLVVFAVTFDGMPDFKGTLLALFESANLPFTVGWFALGLVFASLIYAFSVVAIPMLLDRPVDAITAALTSARLVLAQPGVMLLWAAIIVVLVFLGLVAWFVGMLVIGPVLGFASWHAYRAAVADS